jgi:hypothetical protein
VKLRGWAWSTEADGTPPAAIDRGLISLGEAGMPRIVIASAAGLLFFTAWVVACVLTADQVFKLPFAVQLVYFAVAGFVWVFPIRWLMLWAAHRR